MDRQRRMEEICRQGEVPVLIVGGGVNGAGLFRELSLQGADVLLVDKGDFCCGASAACTRMIHGGLRYLEFGEFSLVRESVTERNLLLQNAPHYVTPLRTTIPLFKRIAGAFSAMCKFVRIGGNRPAHRGWMMVKAGLTMYDFLTRKHRRMPKHRFTSGAEAIAKRPMLDPKTLCTATYYDAWITYAERLGLEMILDAEADDTQAKALNYVSLQAAAGDVVTLRDELTGRTFEVRPKIVVNATGAWIDFANRKLGLDTHLIGGTKGGHLVVDNQELFDCLDGDMIYYETSEGRVAVAMPWLGKCLFGSTDLRVGDPDEVRCTEDEVDYMLESLRQALPGLTIGREHIVSRFTGVRPMRYSGESTTVSVSRAHHCEVIEPSDGVNFPTYAMVGGKWTTFRAFAEQVADRILPRVGLTRRTGSANVRIGGGKDFPTTDEDRQQWVARVADGFGVPAERVETLLRRYGTRAEQVAAFLVAGPDSPLANHSGYTRREIEFILRQERVWRIEDLLLRRTAIALLGELSDELLAELVGLMAAIHGWSDERVGEETARVIDVLADRFGVHLGDSTDK